MIPSLQKTLILAGIISAFFALPVLADDVKMNVPSAGNYEYQLGSRSIADPSGKTHTRAEVRGKVVVFIFSVPNMSQGDLQQKWSDLLASDPKTKISDKIMLVLAEDMSQAGMFKGIARDDMKKDFTPASRPFLVLDETGEFFKRFGIPRNHTEILIYDKSGRLRDVEPNLKDEATVTHRVKVISNRLLEE